MKNMTLSEFESQVQRIAFDVMGSGEIISVDCGKAGKFIIMEEAQYNVMHDALSAVLHQ